MSSALPLRFVDYIADPVILICEGSTWPAVGQRVRAIGSEGNGLLVVQIIQSDEFPEPRALGPERFGIKLKYNEIPWPPDTQIEVIGPITAGR